MKRKHLAAIFGIVLVGIIGLATDSYPQRRTRSKTSVIDKRYSTDTKQLRQKFNADKGKVRLLMLLDPT